MSEQTFAVYYDGKGLEGHQMDASSVSDTIKAFVVLFEEINKVSEKKKSERAKISLTVVGAEHQFSEAFQAGSFGWDFKVLVNKIGKSISAFGGDSEGELGIINQVIFELVKIIKSVRGRKIEVEVDAHGKMTVVCDGEIIPTTEQQARLLANSKIQNALRDVAKPLMKTGIDEFGLTDDIKNKEGALFTINAEEARYFKGAQEAAEKSISEDELEQVFFIHTLCYEPNEKWKLVYEDFNDGNPISVRIEDAEFLTAVQGDKESFKKSDVLVVRLHVKSVYDPMTDRTKTDYTVREVIDHKKSGTQKPLF